MKTDQWMPIQIGEYLRDTAHLDLEAHGLSFMALFRLWLHHGALPNKTFRKILRISPKKFEKKFEKISEFFQFSGEIFTQKRLKYELQKSREITEKKTKAANIRWELERQKDASASIVHTTEEPFRTSPLPLPLHIKNYSEQSIPFRAAKFLYEKILDRNPNQKKPDIQKWAGPIDKMIRIDKREPKDIAKVIEWCQEDEFWQNNI